LLPPYAGYQIIEEIMQRYSPYRNIFMFYRGVQESDETAAKQIEDNITKALINLLENSVKELTVGLLKNLEYNSNADKYYFDLQVSNDESRPDAVIRSVDINLSIESKYTAKFNFEQLEKHKRNVKGSILYISKDKYPDDLIRKYQDERTHFTTWLGISEILLDIINDCSYAKCKNDPVTHFLLNQYLSFMGELNMAPFTGFNARDFNTFLPKETEGAEVEAGKERKRTKEKFDNFLSAVKESLISKDELFQKPEFTYTVGNLEQKHIWGSLKFFDGKLVDQAHISCIMSGYEFSVGVQIEGVKPTKRATDILSSNRDKLFELLSGMEGFIFVIKKRYQKQASKWGKEKVAEIRLSKEHFKENVDMDYVLKNLNQYDYIEIQIVKVFEQYEVVECKERFIEQCASNINNLSKLIRELS
jgi:hypothetical protein